LALGLFALGAVAGRASAEPLDPREEHRREERETAERRWMDADHIDPPRTGPRHREREIYLGPPGAFRQKHPRGGSTRRWERRTDVITMGRNRSRGRFLERLSIKALSLGLASLLGQNSDGSEWHSCRPFPNEHGRKRSGREISTGKLGAISMPNHGESKDTSVTTKHHGEGGAAANSHLTWPASTR